MRSALCVTMLALCLVAVHCIAADEVLQDQGGNQITGDSSAVALTTTTTKEPQPLTLPDAPQSKLDSASSEVLNAPSDAARSADPAITKTTAAQTSLPSSSQKTSEDLKDHLQSPPQQTYTGQGPGVKTKDDLTVIQPKVDNPPNQDGTQPEPDVKTPLVHAALKPELAPPSSGQSKQQTQQPPQSQTPQTPQSNTNPGGAKSQEEIGNASQSGPLAPKRTTTEAATEKRNKDAKESTTTTTVAPTRETSILPTTTLQKETKLPQSGDNKDSSSGTSLLFALPTLFMLAVIPVAPAF